MVLDFMIGTDLINRLAQGLQVDLVVQVVSLQLQQSCLMLVVHHPPAVHDLSSNECHMLPSKHGASASARSQ